MRYSAWTLFYLFDVLALLAVVGLGVFLDARKLVGPVVFVSLSAALMVLGANFGGRLGAGRLARAGRVLPRPWDLE